jgi:putative ABC transport system permease protein
MMSTLLQDLRYGMRTLWRSPGFTLIAVLSLALGIGANTAIFSLVNTVLLRPLAFHEPEQLAIIWEDASFAGFPRNTPAPANYVDWKTQSQSFADMAALRFRTYNITGDGTPERVDARGVTANFFPLLGVQPIIGRTFTPDDDKPEASKVVLLSYSLWQSRYGGETSLMGRDILLNGEKHTVIGVLPPRFQFMDREVELWTPMAFTAQQLANRGSHYLTVVGRMKPGVSLTEARADIQRVMQVIARNHPEASFNGKVGSVVVSLQDELTGDVQRPLIVLLVAVGFVLLIACANIANLLLARAAKRQREIAVRTALGAGRWRIVRQLLTESVLLAALGGVLGLVFASWSFTFLQQLIPEGMSTATQLQIDPRVLGFTLLVTMLTGVIFGLAPALQAARVDLHDALKQGGRSSAVAGGKRLRSAMVVLEVALALVLLVGAGLLIQTFFKLLNQYSGLRPEQVLTLVTELPLSKYDERAARAAFYDQVLTRVRSLPGVVSAGYTTAVPLTWKGGTSGFVIEGRQLEQMIASGQAFDANHREVSADYLKTIGIPLRRGRYIEEPDNAQAAPVVVINETMAREYWPNEDPLGKRLKLGDPDSNIPWVTVVGVVGDVRQMGPDAPIKAEMYFPHSQPNPQDFYAPRALVIRTSVEPTSLAPAVRSEIQAVDPEQPISNVRTLNEILGEETAARRIGMLLLGAFAGLALLLATLGIYGVLSYFVVQHTPEIGVRLALGAQRRDVLRLILKKGMGLTLAGVGLGALAALALTRLMVSLLYGVSASDPLTLIGVALLLTSVALVACLIPARRAMKVDPMVALRYE